MKQEDIERLLAQLERIDQGDMDGPRVYEIAEQLAEALREENEKVVGLAVMATIQITAYRKICVGGHLWQLGLWVAATVKD